MDDYAFEINQALLDLKQSRSEGRHQVSLIGNTFNCDSDLMIPDELQQFIKQRQMDEERMRHISVGVYE